MTLKRRQFLASTGALGAAFTLPASSYGRIVGSNEKLRLCVVGVKGRGQEHIKQFRDNLVALCDCDEKVLGERAKGKSVKQFVDYRKVMEQKDIDAVSIATPNHTHSIIGIAAAMAGKHVYVEKPVSHNVWEGRQLTNAASRYDVLIQCGTQSRSSKALQEAHKFLHDGGLGSIKYAVGTCFKPRKVNRKTGPPIKTSLPHRLRTLVWPR